MQAQGLVEPQVTDSLATGNSVAVAKVASVIERRVVSPSLVRVKIWNAAGTIVYSNEHDLEGQTFVLPGDEINALRHGLIEADVSDLLQAREPGRASVREAPRGLPADRSRRRALGFSSRLTTVTAPSRRLEPGSGEASHRCHSGPWPCSRCCRYR